MGDCECARATAAQDGDAMLQAVLSFLDDHDTVEAFGATSSESTAASSPSQSFGSASSDGGSSPKSVTSDKPEPLARSKKPTRKDSVSSNETPRVPKRSDKRQREEMIALREESLALQDRLDEIKDQLMQGNHASDRPHKKRALESGDDDHRKDELRHLRAQAWQAMTEIQQKRREAAESERERLRELIEQQKRSFRQLRRYLIRHADKLKEFGEVVPASLFDDDDDDTANESSSDADEVDFDELSRAIPTMLLQTGALFTDSRLDNVITSLRDLKVQNEESHKMTIEALESSVVPFDVTTTANAIWQHHLTKAHRRVDSPDRETLEITDSSIRRAFRAAIDVNGVITRARGRMETRRYVENDRVVIVQSSIMDRIEFSSVPLPNFAVRHFQWTVIERPRNLMLRDSNKPLSQVEIYGVNVPMIADMHEASFRDAVKRGCVEAVTLQLEFERQSVENILMQKLVQGTSVDRKMLHVPQW